MRDLDNYFDQYVTHGFEEIQASFRRRLVLDFLHKVNAKRILEVGCGLCPLFLDYHEFESFTVLEPAHGFYEKAQKLAQGTAKISMINATLEEASSKLRGQFFDAVVISSLLHEVTNSNSLLRAAKSLMKAGSTVHVNVPNARSFHRLLGLEMGAIDSLTELSISQVKLQQQSFYTKESLRTLIENQGLSVFDEGSYFIKPFTHHQMAKLVDLGMMTQIMLEGLSRMVKYIPDMGSEIYVNARIPG